MSFRAVFPYFATLVVVGLLFAVFAFRPTPFIGVTPEALSDSINGVITFGDPECEEISDGIWRCEVETGSVDKRSYDVEINDFGCWTATPKSADPELGTPRELAGCVTLFNH